MSNFQKIYNLFFFGVCMPQVVNILHNLTFVFNVQLIVLCFFMF